MRLEWLKGKLRSSRSRPLWGPFSGQSTNGPLWSCEGLRPGQDVIFLGLGRTMASPLQWKRAEVPAQRNLRSFPGKLSYDAKVPVRRNCLKSHLEKGSLFLDSRYHLPSTVGSSECQPHNRLSEESSQPLATAQGSVLIEIPQGLERWVSG